MPRQSWLLRDDVPVIEILLREPFSGFTQTRVLVADTGAGPRFSPFELVLGTADGKRFGMRLLRHASVGGAFRGQFPIRSVQIEIPALNVNRVADALIVPDLSEFGNFDGLAAFRFLNGFNPGNGGNPAEFALQTV